MPSLSPWGTPSSSSGTQVAPALRVPAFQAFRTQQPSGVASFQLPSPRGLRFSPALSGHTAPVVPEPKFSSYTPTTEVTVSAFPSLYHLLPAPSQGKIQFKGF